MALPLRSFLIAGLLLAAVVGLRAPWLGHDLWSLDEGVTFTAAQDIREGAVFYRDVVDHRSPLVPFIKAAVFWVAGDWNGDAVHATLAVLLGFVAILLCFTASRLDRPATGIAAGIAFVMLQIGYVDSGDAMSANTEWFVIIASTVGFTLWARGITRPGFWIGLPVGFSFALATLCKQPGLLDFGVVLVLTALLALPTSADRSGLARWALGQLVGLTVPLLIAVAYFAYQGVLHDAVYYALTYNTTIYVPEVRFVERLLAIRRPFTMAWQHVPVLTVLGLGGAAGLLITSFRGAFRRTPIITPFTWLVLGWTASGILSTALSGREFAHYSEQVIPGLSLAIGWASVRIITWRPARFRRAGSFLAAILIIAAAVSFSLRFATVVAELSDSPQDQRPLGRLVKRFTRPDERILVWGYFPEYYYHAERLPATRFLYTNFLTGMVPWTNLDPWTDTSAAIAPGAQAAFDADLVAHPPALIIDTRFGRGYAKYPISAQPALWRDIVRHYAIIAVNRDHDIGSRCFRRIEESPTELNVPAADTSARIYPELAAIKLSGFHDLSPHQPPQLEVEAPAGYDRIDLIVNHQVRGSLPYSATDPVSVRFFLSDDPFGARDVAVRLRGPNQETVQSHSFDFGTFARHVSAAPLRGPALNLPHLAVTPIVVENSYERIDAFYGEPGIFSFVAPARLLYPCPTAVNQVAFTHGLDPRMLDRSDGYDLIVRWRPNEGDPFDLSRVRVTPRLDGRSRSTLTEIVSLPPRAPGNLEFVFTSGAGADANDDNFFFGHLTGRVPKPTFLLGDQMIVADTAQHEDHSQLRTDISGNWITHASSVVRWPLPSNLRSFSFQFGIDPGAYDPAAAGHSDGMQFTLDLVDDHDERTPLFQRLLEPFNHAEHRGPQTAQVDLPRDAHGHLELTVGPGPRLDSSWDWGWIGEVEGRAPGPPLVLSPTRVLAAQSTSGWEGGWADQFDATHWGAQSPQTLTYPKPLDLSEVTFTFGLSDNAARDRNGHQQSDGVTAILTFTSIDGTRTELYRRNLDPFNHPLDAGPQSATVPVPLGEVGTLTFSMDPGPSGNNSYDWAYWGPFSGIVASPLP